MGTEAVVDVFPLGEGTVERLDLQIAVVDIIELLDVSSVGSLDVSVELGGARGQDEEADTMVLTGLFKGGVELRAAIDLEGLDGEGHAQKERVEECGGGDGGGLGVGLDHVPAADNISSGEVLEHNAGQGTEVEGINLDQIPRLSDGVVSGLAYSVGPVMATPRRREPVAGRLFEDASMLEVGEDAANHRGGHLPALAPQQHYQLVFAPLRIVFSQKEHRLGQLRTPGRRAPSPRAAVLVFQSFRPVMLQPLMPAIEGGTGQAEGLARLGSCESLIDQSLPGRHPSQALPGLRAEFMEVLKVDTAERSW
jgi:hypothetical protein